MTPALLTKTSSLFSLLRNSSADALIVDWSARPSFNGVLDG